MVNHRTKQETEVRGERRRAVRFPTVGIGLLFCPVEGKCLDHVGRDLMEAAGVDMSLSGIAFDVNRSLRYGQKLMVIVESPTGGPGEKLVTEVRWCRALPDGNYRVGTAIQAAESADELGAEVTIQRESIGAGLEFPSEAEFFCPSCCEKATFHFLGVQPGTWQRGMLPLYDCSCCNSTLTITSILSYNRRRKPDDNVGNR
ncbi:MAG: PilZ domain-containing protein [Thermodesulfobacteriota bacterium]|nr:PilZ domain-containing protein [Thermodesulfobacteriota bacterium]